ncbi:MAG: serine hydrolase domain-containing protein [Candidatus Binataceae bacterium]
MTLLTSSTYLEGEARAANVKSYRYSAPPDTGDGWQTASLTSEHLDPALINALFERVLDNTYKNIHSVLLVKNGKLVVEEYFPGTDDEGKFQVYNRDKLHDVASVTKSVTSILIGIALDQHILTNVDQKMSALLPQYSDIFANSDKDRICLKHFLSMTAGLAWDESSYPYFRYLNDHMDMNVAPDPIRYVLEKQVVAVPGTTFDYNSGLSLALGQVILNVSGMPADKFAERHLFDPLGIPRYFWFKYPNGAVQAGGGLHITPRDMAKIGYLYLNGGRWHGRQIVSEAWITASTTQHAPGEGYDRIGTMWWLEKIGLPVTGGWPHQYGYQWWLGSFRLGDRVVKCFSARGRAGQFIFVFPELNLVAVFTGWNEFSLMNQPFDMLERYILPAASAPHTKEIGR